MFKIISYSALHLDNTLLAIETIQAEGIAIFDLEFCESTHLEKAIENLNYTLSFIPKNSSIGIKTPLNKLELFKPLISNLNKNSILILSDFNSNSEPEIPNWVTLLELQIWGEITSISQSRLLNYPNFHSFVLKGNESGGHIGTESAFVLASDLISKSSKPCYIQGGIGIHTAAACFAAGAKGVVIDDHLLAMNSSALPIQWKVILKNLGLEHTKTSVIESKNFRIVNYPMFKDGLQIGWGDPSKYMWPTGQMIGMADQIAQKYKTVGRYIHKLLANVELNVQSAQTNQPLAPLSKMAISNGTRYPIVQGPMTRVSDVPKFIKSVADAGALPFLSLAMTRGKAVPEILQSTKSKLGNKPWGVGLLGFIEEELRLHQFSEVKKAKPPFALISGGTVSQINDFEKNGIKTFVHVPTPSLLKMYLDKGCNRFIFEGRECGGHVGPIGSFSLWQSIIDIILSLPKKRAKQIQVLFAGGIYNDVSSCMLAVMSGQLVDYGVEIGALMGTAYLFTKEVCETGAILPKFQQTAMNCESTSVIEVSPGHSIRCANTPFVEEFNLEKEKGSADLEKLTLGRLRIASKGLQRDNNGNLINLPQAKQYKSGMYMLGEVASLISQLFSMRDLHELVSNDGNKLLNSIQIKEKAKNKPKASNIAIIGISTILPKADTPEKFWTNIINKVDGITEIPKDRWDSSIYYDKDKNAKDKIYSKWGGFIDDVIFDPIKYGIPPHSIKYISPGQLLLLEAVNRALIDAGYEKGGFDREQTSVIVGSDGGSMLKSQYTVRSISPITIDLLTKEDIDRLPDWNEESLPGVLTNLLAGRIANRFNLGGSNFTVDSACASSLTAVDIAVKELEHGNSNMVITAGVDIAMSPFGYTGFSKTQALSPTGESRPFCKSANGIVTSEGVAVILLKRLEDAERDGDKIYGVIKGAASSSDGKGLGITAPRSGGQEKAIFRAFHKAGYSPSTIGMYEAHGTGTAVGDKVELSTINSVLEKTDTKEKSCSIGSVKSLVGHTKTAAGIVGLIKSTLCLYHKTLAPHPIYGSPLDLLSKEKTPLYLLDNAKPWYEKKSHPRRAGISAFGFGGTNSHVTIEEYTNSSKKPVLGNEQWPAELFLFSGDSEGSLLEKVVEWKESLSDDLSLSLRELSFISYYENKIITHQIRLSITAVSLQNLLGHLDRVIKKLTIDKNLVLPPQISLNLNPIKEKGKIGFVFPGQGSQYVNMSLENSIYFEEIRDAITYADASEQNENDLEKIIFPESTFNEVDSENNNKRLRATENAQPALGAISLGYLNLLNSLQIKPDCVAGHSFGELTALYASGVFSLDDFIKLSALRGNLMASECDVIGTMAVVSCTEEEVRNFLNESVFIANLNSPKQIVLSGEKEALIDVMNKLTKQGYKVKEIAVAGPFHTPYFKNAQKGLKQTIDALKINNPNIPVYSNSTGKVYPKGNAKIKALFNKHLLSPVLFMNEIDQMYKDGVRVFLEVGPNSILTGLIKDILYEKPIQAISLEGQGGGVKGLLSAIGAIYIQGFDLNLDKLFTGRNCNYLNLKEALRESKKQRVSKAAVILHGGGIRHFNESVAIAGESPLIDSSSRKEIKSVEHINSSNVSRHLSKDDRLLKGYQAYQETMQQFLNSQETMIKKFLNEETIPNNSFDIQIPNDNEHEYKPKVDELSSIVEQNSNSKIVDDLSKQPAAPIEHKPLANKEYILNYMIQVISERTGYPDDMLNNEIDLEGELGIDSIKRMEIFDKVVQELPAQHEELLKPMMSKLLRTKTIQEFLNIAFDKEILKEIKQSEVTNEVDNFQTVNSTVEKDKFCSRYTMESTFYELPYNTGSINLEGVHIITADNGEISNLLSEKIKKYGGTPILLNEITLGSPQLLEKRILNILDEHPEIFSIIHCSPMSKVNMPEDISHWKNLTQIQSKSLFQILKYASIKPNRNKKFPIQKIITTSSFGGYFGRKNDNYNGLPSSGGNAGMLKAIKKEKTEIDIKIIDFDTNLLDSEITHRIIRELDYGNEFLEVGYPHGERVVFHPVHSELKFEEHTKSKLLDENSVILSIGGAKGITAEITKSLLVPGMKLIIVGRSKTIDLQSVPEASTSKSFQQLIDSGIEIDYFSADVRNSKSFKNLIDKIYLKYGQINAVLHGAGIIEDEYIEQKKLDSFDTVFDTKVDSAFLLYKYLKPESLKLLVFFGSVSGRFGNQGQIDYASANEALNRFAWFIGQQWPKTKTITINWGPWSTTGMASPIVLRLLESQGILPISLEEGCNFFIREINQMNDETSEVIAGEGPWSDEENINIPELEFEHIFNRIQIPSIH